MITTKNLPPPKKVTEEERIALIDEIAKIMIDTIKDNVYMRAEETVASIIAGDELLVTPYDHVDITFIFKIDGNTLRYALRNAKQHA